MSDESVADALRSDAKLVVIEAPAGCGKTHQAAQYAHWLATTTQRGQVLILTHTHAACDVFRDRTEAVRRRVHVTTIDGLIVQISDMYHRALGLPADTAAWAYEQEKSGFERLAEKVANLLSSSRAVASAIVARYPVVVCDEHQDANAAQSAVVVHLFDAGAYLRVFGDPMQAIYVRDKERPSHKQRWSDLAARADRLERLDHPHRWRNGSSALGRWVLETRRVLQDGGRIDLRGALPLGLSIVEAHNTAPQRGGFKLEHAEGRALNRAIRADGPLMILASQNDTVRGVNAYLGRRVVIWEGHTRDALSNLVRACKAGSGDAAAIAEALRQFVQTVGKGFSDTGFATRFVAEVGSGATKRCTGKPAELQSMARCVLESPDHRGIARALGLLDALIAKHEGFREVKIDLWREFREAMRLVEFEDVGQAWAQITRRRTAVRSTMPARFLSTVHKAKGLEGEHVILMPCDRQHFGDKEDKRCLLYVAVSRASHSLTLVVSPSNPSPLLVR